MNTSLRLLDNHIRSAWFNQGATGLHKALSTSSKLALELAKTRHSHKE